ncbi:MAG: hypothetical protein HUJ95_07450, partial [Bacteroidales bacterium]|nr:hypothetical protein [Bacteroidales bacterium]
MKKLISILAVVSTVLISCVKAPQEEAVSKIKVNVPEATNITLTEATISGSYQIEPSSIKADEVGFYYGTDSKLMDSKSVVAEDK